MTADKQRTQHRLRTLGLMASVVAPVFVLCFVAPFFTGEMNTYSLLQFPAGFYLAAQGAVLIFVALIFWMAGHQEATDRKLGATEDL